MTIPAGYLQYAADPSSFAVRIPAGTLSQPIFSGVGAVLYVHSDPAGARVMDLFNAAGQAVTTITASELGTITFWAAPGQGTLWVQPLTVDGAASNLFYAVSPSTLADMVVALQTLVNTLIH